MAQVLIDERIEVAGQLAVRARIFYDIWWFYESAETRPKVLDVINAYSEFFRFDSHANFVAFIVYLAGLFESRSDTVNLPALIRELNAGLVQTGALAEAERLLAHAKTLTPKVMILRSNLYAHRSASLSYEDAFQKASVTPNELHAIIDMAFRIVNVLRAARGLAEQRWDDLSRRQTAAMLQALAERNS